MALLVIFFIFIIITICNYDSIRTYSKAKNISFSECLRKYKYWYLMYYIFLALYGCLLYANYKDQCKDYDNLRSTSIQGDSTVATFDKYGVHLTVGAGQKYTLDPEQMCFYDFVEYTKKGYKIEKKSDTDTIYLIKGTKKVLVTMKRPKF